MLDHVDLLVCGAGPAGCVVAERAASLLDWNVLVLDRRSHLAGNCHEVTHPNGVLVHRYGPHYFRTNDRGVLRYLSRFTDWIPARYEVRSLVRGQLFPFPINLTTLEMFFGRELDPISAQDLLRRLREPISQPPRNSEELILSQVGRQLYEAFYQGYTRKQWGIDARALAPEVCGRIPIRLDRDTRYVNQKYQVMPAKGFTALFTRMLRHPRIRVLTGCDFHQLRPQVRPRHATVYTGAIDEYFHQCLGPLPYRSLNFEFRPLPVEFAQPCVQINYPNDFAFTRSVEIKHVTGQKHPHTVISFETPAPSGEPFYPILNSANQALYARYRHLAEQQTRLNHVYFCGRLAQYRYFNTDEVVREALRCFELIRTRFAPSACLPLIEAA